MAEDYFSDSGGEEKKESSVKGEPVTMLSKSIFPNYECKPGDVLKVEVVSVDGDNLTVKSAGKETEEEEPEEMEEETAPMPQMPMAETASMME